MFRSGFVAIVGRPNMGKSTLLNRMVGQKIAITSPVAQTTRHRIKGVVTSGRGQVVFLDTPGFSKALDRLGEYLTDEGEAALNEADVILMVVDISQPPGKGEAWLSERIAETKKPVVLALNKVDCLKNKPAKRLEHQAQYKALFGKDIELTVLTVSAKTGRKVPDLVDTLLRKLPEGPAYYPEDAVTDQRLREMVAEIIREQVLHQTREEIPHSVAIGIERFEEAPELTSIVASLYVDQTSQKGMLIGRNGTMIKQIGTGARKAIEQLLDQPVFLDLTVKVKKNWRKQPEFLKSLGLAPPEG